MEHYDVVICGAGPAACACGLLLAQSKLKILIVDKDTFPRDKICGDALSADVMNQLAKLPGDLVSKFEGLTTKMPSFGVQFYAPSGQALDIPFAVQKTQLAPGYIIPRYDFDAFMLNEVGKYDNIKISTGIKVTTIDRSANGFLVHCTTGTISAQMVIGADGAHSAVARSLLPKAIDRSHHCAGLRVYYENVQSMHAEGFIELHFYKELLPGYFWIFPLPGNRANVGLGVRSDQVAKNKLNLPELLNKLINEHPNLKDRFVNARPLESIKGFGLPLGSKKRRLSGDGFLLTGDAAGLIDPFTGEGIGNALRSGRIAAEVIIKAFDKQDFTAGFLQQYDKEIYKKMWSELRLSRKLQQLLHYPSLFTFVVSKASKNPSIQKILISMLSDNEIKKELVKPKFYLKLLLGK